MLLNIWPPSIRCIQSCTCNVIPHQFHSKEEGNPPVHLHWIAAGCAKEWGIWPRYGWRSCLKTLAMRWPRVRLLDEVAFLPLELAAGKHDQRCKPQARTQQKCWWVVPLAIWPYRILDTSFTRSFFQGASQATSHNSTALPDVHNVSEEQKHGVLCVKMHMFMIMAFILQRTA
jgi:hypothetical protein